MITHIGTYIVRNSQVARNRCIHLNTLKITKSEIFGFVDRITIGIDNKLVAA